VTYQQITPRSASTVTVLADGRDADPRAVRRRHDPRAALRDVGSHRWHRTLALRATKGDEPTVVAFGPADDQALATVIAGRRMVRCCATPTGWRMKAYNVQYLVAALAREAGIGKRLTPARPTA
jgi:hypothetical protein